MKQYAWGEMPKMILRVLNEYGPMTGSELLEFIDTNPNTLNKALREMNKPSKRRIPVGAKRIHVSAWTQEVEGLRKYPRPIWAIGNYADKRKPPRKTRSQIVSQQYFRKKAKTRMNFVFNLGAPA